MRVKITELPKGTPIYASQQIDIIVQAIGKIRSEIKKIEAHLGIEASHEFLEPPTIELEDGQIPEP